MNTSEKISRKKFLIAGFRYLILASLGFVTIFTIFRKKQDDAALCVELNQCGGCNKANSCNLPQKK